jgi:hypothetical protein
MERKRYVAPDKAPFFVDNLSTGPPAAGKGEKISSFAGKPIDSR